MHLIKVIFANTIGLLDDNVSRCFCETESKNNYNRFHEYWYLVVSELEWSIWYWM